MAILRQSFCYNLFLDKGVPLPKLIQRAARIGYAAVELWGRENSPFDELCALAKENGLRVASMIGHGKLNDGLNKRENHSRIHDELCRSIEISKERDIPGLICFSGNRYDGPSDEECIDICAEGLLLVKDVAERAGVNLNLELLNSKVDHKGYQCDHSAWAFEVVRRVNSPNVKVLYDIYHMQIMEGDIIRTIRENIRLIGHFHTAGNPGRHDFDDQQEMNYAGICRGIAEAGYELYVGHEFTPKGDKLAALERAYHICTSAL
jgi:hydroxypyruvate isomerase